MEVHLFFEKKKKASNSLLTVNLTSFSPTHYRHTKRQGCQLHG